jgi:hypothetical protein
MENWFEEFQSYSSTNRKRYVTMLIGTKLDLVGEGTRAVTREQTMDFLNQHSLMAYHEVSSKTTTGVEEAVADLAQKVSNRAV